MRNTLTVDNSYNYLLVLSYLFLKQFHGTLALHIRDSTRFNPNYPIILFPSQESDVQSSDYINTTKLLNTLNQTLVKAPDIQYYNSYTKPNRNIDSHRYQPYFINSKRRFPRKKNRNFNKHIISNYDSMNDKVADSVSLVLSRNSQQPNTVKLKSSRLYSPINMDTERILRRMNSTSQDLPFSTKPQTPRYISQTRLKNQSYNSHQTLYGISEIDLKTSLTSERQVVDDTERIQTNLKSQKKKVDSIPISQRNYELLSSYRKPLKIRKTRNLENEEQTITETMIEDEEKDLHEAKEAEYDELDYTFFDALSDLDDPSLDYADIPEVYNNHNNLGSSEAITSNKFPMIPHVNHFLAEQQEKEREAKAKEVREKKEREAREKEERVAREKKDREDREKKEREAVELKKFALIPDSIYWEDYNCSVPRKPIAKKAVPTNIANPSTLFSSNTVLDPILSPEEIEKQCQEPWLGYVAFKESSDKRVCDLVLLSTTVAITSTECLRSMYKGKKVVVAVFSGGNVKRYITFPKTKTVTDGDSEISTIPLDPPISYSRCLRRACLPEVSYKVNYSDKLGLSLHPFYHIDQSSKNLPVVPLTNIPATAKQVTINNKRVLFNSNKVSSKEKFSQDNIKSIAEARLLEELDNPSISECKRYIPIESNSKTCLQENLADACPKGNSCLLVSKILKQQKTSIVLHTQPGFTSSIQNRLGLQASYPNFPCGHKMIFSVDMDVSFNKLNISRDIADICNKQKVYIESILYNPNMESGMIKTIDLGSPEFLNLLRKSVDSENVQKKWLNSGPRDTLMLLRSSIESRSRNEFPYRFIDEEKTKFNTFLKVVGASIGYCLLMLLIIIGVFILIHSSRPKKLIVAEIQPSCTLGKKKKKRSSVSKNIDKPAVPKKRKPRPKALDPPSSDFILVASKKKHGDSKVIFKSEIDLHESNICERPPSDSPGKSVDSGASSNISEQTKLNTWLKPKRGQMSYKKVSFADIPEQIYYSIRSKSARSEGP